MSCHRLWLTGAALGAMRTPAAVIPHAGRAPSRGRGVALDTDAALSTFAKELDPRDTATAPPTSTAQTPGPQSSRFVSTNAAVVGNGRVVSFAFYPPSLVAKPAVQGGLHNVYREALVPRQVANISGYGAG